MNDIDLTPAEAPTRSHRVHVTIHTPAPSYVGDAEGEPSATFSCEADKEAPCQVGGECEAADWLLENPFGGYFGPPAPLADGEIEVWRQPVVRQIAGCADYLWCWRFVA